jgi:ElaB/YqjD/DUF883 family membrane-anchored ribosome-binding protein
MPESGTNNENAALEDVRRDMAALKRDLAALREDSGKYMSGAVQNRARSARRQAESMLDSTRDVAEDVADRAATGYDVACDYVRQNPMAAVLVAMGVGAVVGKLFSRKS